MAQRAFRVGGGVLRTGECFEVYWRFAAERQRIFHQRAAGAPPPWTADPVLSRHKFTNVYRAADRVSQYLIRNVICHGSQDADEGGAPRPAVQGAGSVRAAA